MELGGPEQPPEEAVTVYTPWPAEVILERLGLLPWAENPFGPAQLNVTPATGVAERFNVSPTHKVIGPPTTGAAGNDVTVSGTLLVAVPHALCAVAVMVKLPGTG
jgi:hypothetical protein